MLTVLRHSQRNWTSECRSATGRSAIAHFIRQAHPKAVLLPTYCPEGVIDPFEQAAVPIRFYKLRDDLRPDLNHLSKMMVKGATVIVIHYFGYHTETGAIREIVDNSQGLLFEDCAHALFAKAVDADVALWSLNKFLPVVDGAILRSKRRDLSVTVYCSAKPPQLPERILNAYHQHLDLNGRLSRVADPTQAADIRNESAIAYEQYYQHISKDMGLYSPSYESESVAESTNMDEIKQVRSQNALQYHKTIPRCFHIGLKNPVAPFAVPIIVRPPYICEDVFERLLKIGVYAERLIDKWDHIPKGDDRFEIEHAFMDQHLLLPVGEDVSYDDIRRIGACLREITSESS